MQLGIEQEIFPISHYQLPITGLHRYDKSLNGHDIRNRGLWVWCEVNLTSLIAIFKTNTEEAKTIDLV
ncbi:hypothetical protein CEN46_25195 [Fischerella thermalis CCMEE 5318]|uniref:Uncharacterized protein n=1 Tax=Fischerella thermalis CCMEE 5318 TaxID=2019666 RepID=A0A2N6L4Q7_9CYAN|nr:hypothetical protein CEN46_25195 [Fischerella thermalis CCMEE 5318]